MVVRLKDLDEQQVKGGVVRLSDLEEPKKTVIRLADLEPAKDTGMTRQDFTKLTGVKTAIPTVQDIPMYKNMQQNPLPTTTYDPKPELTGRNLPIVGHVLRGLDAVSENPVVQKVGEIGRMFYTPGAGGANVAGLTGAAESAVGKLAPNLGKTLLGKVGQKAATEAIVGAPLGAGQYLANNGASGNADLGEAAKQAGYGMALGGAIGGASPIIGAGVKKVANNMQTRKAFNDFIKSTENKTANDAYNSAAVNTKYAETGSLPNNYNVPNAQAEPIANRLRFVDQQVNGNGLLGLPESRGERMMNEAQSRANQTGDGVIYGPGKTVYEDHNAMADHFGLPAGNYIKPERLKVAGNDQTLDSVMQKIKPIVIERMTPPLENPTELARYVQQHVGTSMNELRRLPYNDLVDLAKDASKNMDMFDMSVKAAKEIGYDLPRLLEGRGQGLPDRIASDAQKRMYGVYPEHVNIKQPEGFNTSITGEAAAPRQQLKATGQLKPQVGQPKVEVIPTKNNLASIGGESNPALQPKGSALSKYAAERTQSTAGATGTRPPKGPAQRGFINTIQQSEKADAPLRAYVEGTYKPITNEETVAQANKRINKDRESADAFVMGNSRSSAEKTATAIRLIDEYSTMGNHERAATVAGKIAEELTRAGQTVQAASLYNRLSPEGVLIHAQRIATKTNETLSKFGKDVKVTPELSEQIVDLANVTRKMTGTKTLANDVMDILEKAKSGGDLDAGEKSALKRFVDETKQFVKDVEKKPRSPRPPQQPKDKRIRDNLVSFLDAQEAAAKERLRAKGIRISSTPLDIWADYAVIGAAKMANGAIKFADWSEVMLKELGNDIKPHLENLYEKASEAFSLSTKKVDKQTVSTAERITEQVLQKQKGNLTPHEIDTFRSLAQKVSSLSGDAKAMASQDLQALLQTLEKPGILKKVSSVQTMGQLLNPKTIVRNVAGNEIMYRVERLQKLVSTPIDIARSKLTGAERTVTLRTNNQGEYWKNFMRGGSAGWKGVNINGLETQFDLTGPAFRSKLNPLTYLEKALGASLRSFDNAGYMRAVNNTIGEMATLRAINEGLKGEARTAAIQKYIREADDNILSIADQYGKYVTFQDSNIISKGLVGLKRGLNLGKDFGVGDFVLKYPKTPGNLLMRALEYSPAGFVRSAYTAAKPYLMKGAEAQPAEVIQALSRAIIGTTGLSGLGYYLYDKGILTGAASKDKDIRDLERSAGKGQYQVNLSALYRWATNGFSSDAAKLKEGDNMYTYDWAQPLSVAVSLGANVSKNVGEDKKATSGLLGTAYNSIEGSLNTLTEQSVLQGLKSAAQGYPGQTVMDKVTDILSDVPSSFVPTALNQVKQVNDNAKRETYSLDKLDQSLNKAKAKVPGLASSLPQQTDTLGKPKETYQNNSLFNVFLNPGFQSKYQLSPEAKLIVDLINETGDESIAPRVPDKSLTYQGDNGKSTSMKLDGKQLARMQEIQGNKTRELISKLKNPTSESVKKAVNDAADKSRVDLRKELGLKQLKK